MVSGRCGGSFSQAALSTDGPATPCNTPAATAAPVAAASQRRWQQADQSAGAEKAIKRRYAGPDPHRLCASRHRWDVEVPSPQRSLLPAEGWVMRPPTSHVYQVDPWGVVSMYLPALGLPPCSRCSICSECPAESCSRCAGSILLQRADPEVTATAAAAGYQLRRLPVLMMLHGAGDNGTNMVQTYQKLADKYRWASLYTRLVRAWQRLHFRWLQEWLCHIPRFTESEAA